MQTFRDVDSVKETLESIEDVIALGEKATKKQLHDALLAIREAYYPEKAVAGYETLIAAEAAAAVKWAAFEAMGLKVVEHPKTGSYTVTYGVLDTKEVKALLSGFHVIGYTPSSDGMEMTVSFKEIDNSSI
jgi:hypothetical protein